MMVPHRHKRRGSALLETALVLPLFLALVLGVSDFSRILCYSQAVTSAARAGAEFGALSHGELTDLRRVEEAAVLGSGLPGLTSQASTFVKDGRKYLQVTSEYRFKPTWGYPGLPNPLLLKGSAVMRLQ